MNFFKSIGIFSVFFVVLCLPVQNKMIFDHITEFAEPYVDKVFGETKRYVKKGGQNAKELSGRLFENVKPIKNEAQNDRSPDFDESEELEEYTHSDKETLGQIFKGRQ